MLALEEGLMLLELVPGVFSGMCNSLQGTGLTNQARLLHGPPNFHKAYQETLGRRIYICGLIALEVQTVIQESALR